jgi:hypothetical protein
MRTTKKEKASTYTWKEAASFSTVGSQSFYLGQQYTHRYLPWTNEFQYLTNPLIKPLEEIAKVILLEISRYGVLTNTLHLYAKKKD